MVIRFNYARPRYWEEKKRWVIPSGGDTMQVKPLKDIRIGKNKEKGATPWLQMFSCGYRVTSSNIQWDTWNGCVYSDIDSKHYYNECKPFDAIKLEEALHEYLLINFNYNYYALQASNSGTGYHVLFYFNVDKTEEGFKKCAQRVREIMCEAFTNIGAGEIFEWPHVADKCSESPYQGMYLTDKPWYWGNPDQPGFGSFEDFETYELQKERIRVSDVQVGGADLFKLKAVEDASKTIGYKNHYRRRDIYDALIAVFKEKTKVDEEWKKIANLIPEENKHTHKFYEEEPDRDKWYKKYNGRYVKVSFLEEFGYRFKKEFVPKDLDLYKPDLVYELEADQHLTDIDIEWDTERCNHVFAGCGFGKTFMAKEFTNSGKRVCFISPMTSINKDSFDKDDASRWLIVDESHTKLVEYVCGSVKNALLGGSAFLVDASDPVLKEIYVGDPDKVRKGWSICTTWESFYLYEMWNYNFDYFVIDEIHTLYMYDYRLQSIANLKNAIRRIKGIRILMTGTPSYEVEEFDCKKILVNKRMEKVKADVIFYYKSAKGYIYNDIRNWINESVNNIALLFRDQTNYKTEDDLKYYGIDCDVFNKQYSETVDYILNNQNTRKQVTAFSVYGQAGINLYIDTDKRVRMYILNENALSIIQYANRVRNKEVIDKVIIPYKYSRLNNDQKYLNTVIDYDNANRKVKMINSNRGKYDFYADKNRNLFEVQFGLIPEVMDDMGNQVLLDECKYQAYRMIKNVQQYETQMQLIYNRLSTNYFDVNFIYPDKDISLAKHSKHRSDRFSGQMVRFDWAMVQETMEGVLWIKATAEFNKVVTGDLKEVIERIINRFYNTTGYDKEKTSTEFKSAIQEIVRRKGSITKADIIRYDEFQEIMSYFGTFIDNEFLEDMTKDDWNLFKESARYTRTLYNETIDWKAAAKEVYSNLKKLSGIVYDYLDTFMFLPKVTEKMDIPDDEVTQMIEKFLWKSFCKRKKKGGPVVVDGVRYSSISEAMNKTGLSRSTIWRKVRQSAQVDAGSVAGGSETIR